MLPTTGDNMNKTGGFFASFAAWMLGFLLFGQSNPNEQIVNPTPPSIVNPKPIPPKMVEPDCIGVQVPISKANRIYNKSGSQCVWVSIETLARHNGVKDIYEGDACISKHYTWATGPGEVSKVLNSKYSNVKWKHIDSRSQLKPFVKRYVTELKFGVGLAIPGHMLTLIHYDESAGVVKVIDNSGSKSLQVQEWSMDKFDRLADGWVLVIFPPGHVETSEDRQYTCDFIESDRLYGSH
jgi:hypothetical protein